MIHLSQKPFMIYPKTLIDKHISVLKSLDALVDVSNYAITRNKDRQPVIILNKTINVGGSMDLQIRLMRSAHVETMVSVAKSEVGLIVYIGAIPNSMKLETLTSVEMDKLKNNIKKITHGMAVDELSMIAHEATHMIDLPKYSGKYSEGAETLAENFENNNWLEINALLNEVAYCFPEATDSYDKFVECFMDESVNYEISDKKDTFYTDAFKPAVESIIRQRG